MLIIMFEFFCPLMIWLMATAMGFGSNEVGSKMALAAIPMTKSQEDDARTKDSSGEICVVDLEWVSTGHVHGILCEISSEDGRNLSPIDPAGLRHPLRARRGIVGWMQSVVHITLQAA